VSEIQQPKLVDSSLIFNERVALLTFNRDDVRNALTGSALVDDICHVAEWIKQEPTVSALVITGAGKAFSAGGNIKDMQAREGDFSGTSAELITKYRNGIQRMSLAVPAIEVPTIAAVNGPAIGAGFDLASMCDIRIGSTQALFGETFLNLGLIPGDGGAWFLQRAIGYQRAAELTFSGRLVGAQEALELGVLLEVTEPDVLLERAQELAASFAKKPPQAVRMTKSLMKSAQRMELPDFLDLCAAYQGACHQTEDHAKAVSAFFDKTDPEYQGR